MDTTLCMFNVCEGLVPTNFRGVNNIHIVAGTTNNTDMPTQRTRRTSQIRIYPVAPNEHLERQSEILVATVLVVDGGWRQGFCLACRQIWTSPAHHPGCALYHAPPPRRATADSTCARLWGSGASPVRRRWLLANRSASQTQRRRAWGLEDANDQGVVCPGGDTTQPLREVCRALFLSA